MKKLKAPFTTAVNRDSSLEAISSFLNEQDRHKIDVAPWGIKGLRPEVSFVIAHTGNSIILKYYVAEQYTLARFRHSNDPVYRDSCVEFFIAPEGEDRYYNFEFNCIGSCLMGYGTKHKPDRKYQSPDVIDKIKRSVNLVAASPGGLINWELTLMLPIEVFCHHQFATLKGGSFTANFYKCGDDLPIAHFLAWNAIDSKDENFHLPEFFGGLQFSE